MGAELACGVCPGRIKDDERASSAARRRLAQLASCAQLRAARPSRMSASHAGEDQTRQPIRDVVDRIDNNTQAAQDAVSRVGNVVPGISVMAEAIAIGVALEIVITVIDALRNAKTNVRRAAWRGGGRAAWVPGRLWVSVSWRRRQLWRRTRSPPARASHTRCRRVSLRRSGPRRHSELLRPPPRFLSSVAPPCVRQLASCRV
jgi:hypothetical protein